MNKRRFDWGNYDNVRVTFWVVKPLDDLETARAFLELLEQFGYGPDRISTLGTDDRFVPLQEHQEAYYQGWTQVPPNSNSKIVMLRRTQRPRGSLNVTAVVFGILLFDLLDVDLELAYFQDQANQQKFLQLARELYSLLRPAYGILENSTTMLNRTGPIGLKRGLPGIFWANFLGPEYTEMFGWDRLEALSRELPVTVERLPDDGLLLILGDDVLQSNSPEMLARAEAVERFLGEEFFAKTSPSRSVRGAEKVSFEDIEAGRVAPEVLRKLFLPEPPPRQGTVPAFRFQELRRQRYEEWQRSTGVTAMEGGLDDDTPLFIPQPQTFIEDVPRLVEKLKARLRAKGVELDYSEKSLTLIDDFILNQAREMPDPSADEEAKQLVRELSAYYGEVIRRHLKGRWGILPGDLPGVFRPKVFYTFRKEELDEDPLFRVLKLWEDRLDTLTDRYDLLRSGKWALLLKILRIAESVEDEGDSGEE